MSPIDPARIQPLNEGPLRADGEYVLYSSFTSRPTAWCSRPRICRVRRRRSRP